MKSGLESWQFSSILLFLCDSEILPDKRGRLWWVWPYKRENTVLQNKMKTPKIQNSLKM